MMSMDTSHTDICSWRWCEHSEQLRCTALHTG